MNYEEPDEARKREEWIESVNLAWRSMIAKDAYQRERGYRAHSFLQDHDRQVYSVSYIEAVIRFLDGAPLRGIQRQSLEGPSPLDRCSKRLQA